MANTNNGNNNGGNSNAGSNDGSSEMVSFDQQMTGGETAALDPSRAVDAMLHQIRRHDFKRTGMVDTSALSRAYSIESIIEDRLAGLTLTEEIWSGQSINSAYVSRLLTDEATRRAAVQFFTRRDCRAVISKILPGSTARIGGYRATIAEALDAVRSVTNASVSGPILELLAPGLLNAQLIEPTKERPRVMNRYTEPFRISPPIDDLVAELARMEIERAVRECQANWIVEDKKTYAVRALGSVMAEAYFPLGLAIRTAFDYASIAEDIVKAVRVVIDPDCLGLTGDMPREIYESEVVRILATNWTFVSAALSLPQGATIAPTNGAYKFDKLAPAMLAMIKTSDRYALRHRTDVLSSWSLQHVHDVRGVRVAGTITENAKMDPVALSVIALPDSYIPGAVNIAESIGRFDAHMAAAYGSVADRFGLVSASEHLRDVLRHSVESDALEPCAVYSVAVREHSLEQLAVLLADSVMFQPGADPDAAVVYVVRTSGQFPDGVASGLVERQDVYTTDPAEVLLAHDPFDAKSASVKLPQLLPKAALGAVLFTDSNDAIVQSSQRYSFNYTVGKTAIRGSLRWAELESARADNDAALVRPTYNAAIYDVVSSVVDVTLAIAKRAPKNVSRHMQRIVGGYIVELIRGVAKPFRSNIHELMVLRSMGKMDQHSIRLQRAQLNTMAVRGFTDAYAAGFFFSIQGMGSAGASSPIQPAEVLSGDQAADLTESTAPRATIDGLFSRMWTDPVLVEVLTEKGTERSA